MVPFDPFVRDIFYAFPQNHHLSPSWSGSYEAVLDGLDHWIPSPLASDPAKEKQSQEIMEQNDSESACFVSETLVGLSLFLLCVLSPQIILTGFQLTHLWLVLLPATHTFQNSIIIKTFSNIFRELSVPSEIFTGPPFILLAIPNQTASFGGD